MPPMDLEAKLQEHMALLDDMIQLYEQQQQAGIQDNRKEAEDKTRDVLKKHDSLEEGYRQRRMALQKQITAARQLVASVKSSDGSIDADALLAEVELARQATFDHALLVVAAGEGSLDRIRNISGDHRKALGIIEAEKAKAVLLKTIGDRDSTIRGFKSRITEKDENLKSKDEELKRTLAELEASRQKGQASAEESKKAEAKYAALEQKYAALKKELGASKEQLITREAEKTVLSSQLAIAQNNKQQVEGELTTVRTQLDSAKESVRAMDEEARRHTRTLPSARKREHSPGDGRDEQAARRPGPPAHVAAEEEDDWEVGDDDPKYDNFAEEEDGGKSEEAAPHDGNALAEEEDDQDGRHTGEDSPDPFGEDEVDFEDEEFTDESAIESQSEDEAPQIPSSVAGRKATAAQKQQKLVDDFKDLPTELQTVAQHHSAKLARAASSSKAFFGKYRGEIKSMRVLEGWIRTAQEEIEAGVWTQEEEDDFQQRIRDDPYLAYLRPIISPLNHLEYDGRVALADGTEVADPVWTRGFCDRLVRLALGGPWGGNVTLLALFIRYAVACRINDRGAVPFAHGTDSWFMDEACARLWTRRDGSKSIPQIHKEVRRAAEAKSLGVPWYSLLMRNIEKVAYGKETPVHRGAGGEGRTPYRVRTEDLHCVERAVHHCKDLGLPMFASLGDRARVLSHGRSYDLPKTDADLRHLLVLAHVAWERRRRIEQLHPPMPSPPRAEFSNRGEFSDRGQLSDRGGSPGVRPGGVEYYEDFGGPGDSPLPSGSSGSEGSDVGRSAPKCDLPSVFPIPGMEGLETSRSGGGASFTIWGLKDGMLRRPTAREEKPDVVPQLDLTTEGRHQVPFLDGDGEAWEHSGPMWTHRGHY
ncbi:hypothetical protein DL768_011745 [Monosporascus sp. mg162]|nr:hypothetical protein DL768_011745 [Monosporascus sp. mg162]